MGSLVASFLWRPNPEPQPFVKSEILSACHVQEQCSGVCTLNKRERVWAAEDLFSRLTQHESLRCPEPNTNFILAAWAAKVRGHFSIGLAGLDLWVSLCKYLMCGRSSVCFFDELLETSKRFVRLKDITGLLLALRLTNLVLGKIQWVFDGSKVVFVVEKSGLFAVQKTWGNKKIVTLFAVPAVRSVSSSWAALSLFLCLSHIIWQLPWQAGSLIPLPNPRKCSGCLKPCGSDFHKRSGLILAEKRSFNWRFCNCNAAAWHLPSYTSSQKNQETNVLVLNVWTCQE